MIHPGFNNSTLVHDIALLRLEKPAKRKQVRSIFHINQGRLKWRNCRLTTNPTWLGQCPIWLRAGSFIPIRGCSQITLTKFWLFLTNYPPALTFSMVWTLTKSGHFWTTYLPHLVNVVCQQPLNLTCYIKLKSCPETTSAIGRGEGHILVKIADG